MAREKELNQGNETSGVRDEQSQGLQAAGGQGNQGSRQGGLATRGQSSASLFGGNPFAFMRRFSEEVDRLFEDFGFSRSWLSPSFGRDLFSAPLGEFGGATWSPQVEAFERDGRYIVRADLPGLNKEDVKVEVTDEAITISGERKQEHEEEREGFYRSERSYGSFFRRLPLPEGVKADDATATFKNGVLEISMQAPQREERRSRRLQIKDASEDAGQTRANAAAQK